MDIFVGSLSFKLKESELREAFEKYGKVSSAKIIIDKITRQSKGFGFVEMPDESEAKMAISSLNGAEMYGRALVVNESQKREPRADGGGGAPRGDFKRDGFNRGEGSGREGFNRPRPTDNREGYRPRPAENSEYRPSSPSPSTDPDLDSDSRGSSSDRDSGGGGSFGFERPKTDRRASGGHDRGGHGSDRGNNNSNRSRSENRFGKNAEPHRRGGGGSKSNWGRTDDDDDDRW